MTNRTGTKRSGATKYPRPKAKAKRAKRIYRKPSAVRLEEKRQRRSIEQELQRLAMIVAIMQDEFADRAQVSASGQDRTFPRSNDVGEE